MKGESRSEPNIAMNESAAIKKLLFVCSRNRIRSLTAEKLFEGFPLYQVSHSPERLSMSNTARQVAGGESFSTNRNLPVPLTRNAVSHIVGQA
jgi:predicted protein tyrosine phosphatase